MHARRNFIELHQARKGTIAAEALTRIAALYDVERDVRDQDTHAHQDHRQQHARPKVEALFAWLTQLRPTSSDSADNAKAIDYPLERK